ncbi:MAG: ABC transporter permease [Oscillibacter sp.]|nr:ABC transporter permease [Oscillibacter sp.]
MKSKTSFFNATLYKKNLTRFWPLWGLTAFFGGLVPLSGMMMYLNGDLRVKATDFAQAYYGGVAYFAPVVTLCYAALCAMAVWSYLYNPRSVGMMHALPIRREALFVTNFLSGLTMVAIPWAVVGALCAALSLMSGAFSAGPLFLTILCIFGEGLFYFASATAAAFVTGNVFALPALYFLFHFLAPTLDFLVTQFSSNMIFGLQSRVYTGVADWLSPTVYIMKNVNPKSVYEQVPIPGQPNATESVLRSVTLENAWVIAVYALAGLALLGAAYALYRYRQSECAGEVVAMRWGRPVFRYGIAALCALGGGQLLYVMLFNAFDIDSNTYRILPLIACMLVAGAIGYYGASMLLAKTLRVFKGSLRGLAIVAAGCVVVCCFVGFDLLGIANRVPSVDEVKYVRLYTANNTYYLFPGEDSAVIEEWRGVHKAIIADKDYMRGKFRNPPVTSENDYRKHTYMTVRVCYYLKNGLTVDRHYPLWLSQERMQEPGTYDNLLDRFVNSTEMKLRRLRFGDPRFIVENGNIDVQRSGNGFEFSSRELQEILAAIAADAKADAWGQYDWFDEDNTTYAVSMFFWYSVKDIEELANRDNINVYLRPGMENTIAALKKMGYLTDEDLITQSEMRKIWEERDSRKFVQNDASDLSDTILPEAVTEGAALSDDANANPNSAPQTPAESSAASMS